MKFSVKREPQKGNIKYKKKFALLPKKIYINNSESITIWLEFYYKKYEYTYSMFEGWHWNFLGSELENKLRKIFELEKKL